MERGPFLADLGLFGGCGRCRAVILRSHRPKGDELVEIDLPVTVAVDLRDHLLDLVGVRAERLLNLGHRETAVLVAVDLSAPTTAAMTARGTQMQQ